MGNDNRLAPRRGAPRSVDLQPILSELITVLKPHARGLRRWSVMKAMRDNRKRKSREIPHKFEDDVERVFRRFCADGSTSRTPMTSNENAPFYRPLETAGEVWAVHPERAEELLADHAPHDGDGMNRFDRSRW